MIYLKGTQVKVEVIEVKVTIWIYYKNYTFITMCFGMARRVFIYEVQTIWL